MSFRLAREELVGLWMALLTALLWAMLPVILKILLNWLDPVTLTWYRFVVAGAVLGLIIGWGRGFRPLLSLRGPVLALVVLCVVGLCGNYVTYLMGLVYVAPGTAQVVMQLSPMFVLFGGLVLFKESFSRLQWIGFVVLVTGLLLFFNQRYNELVVDFSTYSQGIVLIVAAGVLWAVFILAQKSLLAYLPSVSILFLVYLGGAVAYFPFVDARQALALVGIEWVLLGCSIGFTLVSYLSFAAALKRIEASRLGVLISTTPLITVGLATFAATLFPGYIEPEALNSLSLLGASLVVAGSMCCALGRR